MTVQAQRPCVLVFAGHDPSGGAGIQADIEAIAAQGAHALTVITALTVQDHNHVVAVHPVAAAVMMAQAQIVCAHVKIAAIKIGIVGSAENAQAIADFIQTMRITQPDLPVILDPVLGSGRGHNLGTDDAVASLQRLLPLASLITPNLLEIKRLCPDQEDFAAQAKVLFQGSCAEVLLKGGHAEAGDICNRWFSAGRPSAEVSWSWPRMEGEFHGSGCTLASAIAGQLALGHCLEMSLLNAQKYTQASLENAYRIGDGQAIPNRTLQRENKHES